MESTRQNWTIFWWNKLIPIVEENRTETSTPFFLCACVLGHPILRMMWCSMSSEIACLSGLQLHSSTKRLLCKPPRTTWFPRRQSEWTKATSEQATQHLCTSQSWNVRCLLKSKPHYATIPFCTLFTILSNLRFIPSSYFSGQNARKAFLRIFPSPLLRVMLANEGASGLIEDCNSTIGTIHTSQGWQLFMAHPTSKANMKRPV